MLLLPVEIQCLNNTRHKRFAYCTLTRFRQKDSTFKQMVEFTRHTFIFVKKEHKVMHTKQGDFRIHRFESLFFKAGAYTLSNIPFEENMHISEPLIVLKFEEIFLYFVLNNHVIF